MKKFICSTLLGAQLISCVGNVDGAETKESGDTTEMYFGEDSDGNTKVSPKVSDDEPRRGAGGGAGGAGQGEAPAVNVDVPGFFKGLGEMLGKMGGLIEAGVGELTGANRRKKKEAENKAKELIGLANEVSRLQGEIGQRGKELEQATQSTASSDFFGNKDTQDAVNQRGLDHNNELEKTKGTLPELGNDPSTSDNPPEGDRDPYPTPEKEKVRRTRDYIDGARKQVGEQYSGEERQVREGALDAADAMVDAAADAYGNGDGQLGDEYADTARKIADMVISATPIAGDLWGLSNAILGKNPLTGEVLSDEERVVQGIGAIFSLATGGGLGEIKRVSDIIKGAVKAQVKKEMRNQTKEKIKEKTKERQDSIDRSRKAAEEARASKNSGEKSAPEFEKGLRNLPPGERVARVREALAAKANEYGWTKDRKLTKINDRDVYRDKDGNLWAVDTQHGRYEKCDDRGKHQGEYNIDLDLRDAADASGGHNLIVD